MIERYVTDENGNVYVDPMTNKPIVIETEATLEDISELDLYWGQVEDLDVSNGGITWADQYAFFDQNDEIANVGTLHKHIPIVASDGISFDKDQYGETVLIGVNNTVMRSPSTWSTGTTSTAKLLEAGLYEVKFTLTASNGYSYIVHTVMYWDGVQETKELLLIDGVDSNSKNGFIARVLNTGIIDIIKFSIASNSMTGHSAPLAYRKIGSK